MGIGILQSFWFKMSCLWSNYQLNVLKQFYLIEFYLIYIFVLIKYIISFRYSKMLKIFNKMKVETEMKVPSFLRGYGIAKYSS